MLTNYFKIAWRNLLKNKADFEMDFCDGWGIAIGITLLTISLQAKKAAMLNPVESLRNE